MRPTFRLVSDFIIPHLNNSTYGCHLLWENKRQGSFKISRIHQSSEMWDEQCIEVYKAWSLKKNHWNIHDPKRITRAKHRLITALRRSPEIEMLKKESRFYRFRIVQGMKLDKKNSIDYISTIPTKTNHETSKRLEPTEDIENFFTKNILEDNKEQTDPPVFITYDPNTNLSQLPHYQPEIFDAQKEILCSDYNFTDDVYFSETKSTSASDKCCCIKLLDIYLCNQKCIWHGLPP